MSAEPKMVEWVLAEGNLFFAIGYWGLFLLNLCPPSIDISPKILFGVSEHSPRADRHAVQ